MHLLSWILHVILPLLLCQVVVNGDNAGNSYEFKIFFVNDMNYGFYPVNKTGGNSCKNATDGECVAGLSRLASQLKNVSATSKSQNSSIWLNAGGFLGESSETFDLLKLQPAMDAMNSLNFDAVAIGSEVFQYGRKSALNAVEMLKGAGLAVNMESLVQSVGGGLTGSKTFKLANHNVTVIGFLDMDGMRGKDSSGWKVDDEYYAINNFIIDSKAKNGKNSTYIAIGRVKTLERAKEIAKIQDLDILIFSVSNLTNVTYENGIFAKPYSNSWLISSQPPNATQFHHILGEVTVTVTNNQKDVTVKTLDYSNVNQSEDKQILKIEAEGLARLNSMKYDPLALTKSTIDRDDCLKQECLLGNVVTDAMVAAFDGLDNQAVDAAVWNQYFTVSERIEANTSFTEEQIHKALGVPDESIYTITLSFKKFICYLEKALSSSKKGEEPFLQLSGLYLDYEEGESKVGVVKGVGRDMRLEYLNMSSEANITVALPAHLLLFTFDVARFADAHDTGVTVGDAVAEWVRRSASTHKVLRLPLLGLRYTPTNGSSSSIFKCLSNTSEAVLLTLAAVVVLAAGALLVWCVVLPRIRARRNSSASLLS